MMIPQKVEYILMHLEFNGYNAYLVGGSTRDIFNYKN